MSASPPQPAPGSERHEDQTMDVDSPLARQPDEDVSEHIDGPLDENQFPDDDSPSDQVDEAEFKENLENLVDGIYEEPLEEELSENQQEPDLQADFISLEGSGPEFAVPQASNPVEPQVESEATPFSDAHPDDAAANQTEEIAEGQPVNFIFTSRLPPQQPKRASSDSASLDSQEEMPLAKRLRVQQSPEVSSRGVEAFPVFEPVHKGKFPWTGLPQNVHAHIQSMEAAAQKKRQVRIANDNLAGLGISGMPEL